MNGMECDRGTLALHENETSVEYKSRFWVCQRRAVLMMVVQISLITRALHICKRVAAVCRARSRKFQNCLGAIWLSKSRSGLDQQFRI